MIAEVFDTQGAFQYATLADRKAKPCYFCKEPTRRVLSYLTVRKEKKKDGIFKRHITIQTEMMLCDSCRGCLTTDTINEVV
jgi:hypothetical protein